MTSGSGERRKQADADFLRELVDASQDVLFETDGAGVFTYLNPAWEAVTGRPVSLSVGRSLFDFIHARCCCLTRNESRSSLPLSGVGFSIAMVVRSHRSRVRMRGDHIKVRLLGG